MFVTLIKMDLLGCCWYIYMYHLNCFYFSFSSLPSHLPSFLDLLLISIKSISPIPIVYFIFNLLLNIFMNFISTCLQYTIMTCIVGNWHIYIIHYISFFIHFHSFFPTPPSTLLLGPFPFAKDLFLSFVLSLMFFFIYIFYF